MAEMNQRDAKLVQWLNEAYAKEAELEQSLTLHIGMTGKDAYKKRLQQHLKETKDHKKAVGQRIKKLGGSPGSDSGIPGIPGIVSGVAGKAVSGVKGQLGVARAAVTEQAATHLRNAQEERREEQVEIAIYTRIETLAELVGDKDTVRVAKDIRKQEERMAKFLDAELVRLVKDVVKLEIPKDQRDGAASRPASRRKPSASAGRGRASNGTSPARAARTTKRTASK